MIQNRENLLDTLAQEIVAGDTPFDGRDLAVWLRYSARMETESFFVDLGVRLRAYGQSDIDPVIREWRGPTDRMHDLADDFDVCRMASMEGPGDPVRAFRENLSKLAGAGGAGQDSVSRYAEYRMLQYGLGDNVREEMTNAAGMAQKSRADSFAVAGVSRAGGSRLLFEDGDSAVVLSPRGQGMVLSLVDRTGEKALVVDLMNKDGLELVSHQGRRALSEEEAIKPYLDHVSLSPSARAFLEKGMKDFAACLDNRHAMTPDGDFIAIRSSDGRFNLVSNFSMGGEYGHILFSRGLTERPQLYGDRIEGRDGNTVMTAKRTEDNRIEVSRRLSVETRTLPRRIPTPLNLQSSNHDWEAVSQRAAYVESIGRGDVKKSEGMESSVKKSKTVLHEELYRIRYREQEESLAEETVNRKVSRHRK